jgi:hypothetical protein
VSGDCTITVSHGNGSKSNLYDRDKVSKWQTSGANNDATVVSIEVVFKEGSTAIDRAIDSLLLINHNLKNWDFYYWNGSSYVLLTGENTDSASTTFKSFSIVTTSKVKLEVDSTQTLNAEKFVGEMIVAALQVDIGEHLEPGYDVNNRERKKELLMGDGSIHTMTTRWSPNQTQKYEARVKFTYVLEALRTQFKAVCDARVPFLWYPESIYRPDDIFLVQWTTPWRERYMNPVKGVGVEIDAEFKES